MVEDSLLAAMMIGVIGVMRRGRMKKGGRGLVDTDDTGNMQPDDAEGKLVPYIE